MFLAIMSLRIMLFIFTIALLCSCNKQNNEFSITVLSFDSTTSHVQEEKLIRDSIVINYYSKDSILLLKYYDGDYTRYNYFYKDDELFEKRIKANLWEGFLGIDSILTFSKKDTVFSYHYNRLIVMVTDYGYADCIYMIEQKGNEYKTIKQSAIDTTYKEIFFYDKDYNIYKYINIWQDNEYVYMKKE